MKASEKTMDTIVNLCKARGFIFPGSEIYGGLSNSWDYGPLGVEFKNNVKKAWWKKFVQESPTNVGVDAAILMNPQVWVATGHVGGFSDPLMDCKECKERFRADKVIEDWCQENSFELGHSVDAMSQAEMKAFVEENFQGVEAEGKVLVGYASEEILRHSVEDGCDLIVMGTHGRKGIDRILFGSVAEKVVQNSTIPVLTVRPEDLD